MKCHARVLIYAGLFILLCGATAQAEQERGSGKASNLSHLVDINNVRFHQQMLQQIARLNDNNRAAGTRGYDQSSRYVRLWLKMAGYRVQTQSFEFPFYQELSVPLFQRTVPESEPYPANTPRGFFTGTYSGGGDVEGAVVPVDVVMPPGDTPNSSSSGCEAEDFALFPAGAVALIQRGTCSFYEKARNARAAGASAVIFYNEGQAGRTEAFAGSIEQPEFAFPVVFASYAIGRELYELVQKREVRVHLRTDTISETRITQNILAATRTGDPSRKVIVGAHLDSVMAGPGINDNGSGAAAVLEVAVKMAWRGTGTKHKVVFAFWGAEELGLRGSAHYLDQLTKEERAAISLYLNFDMIGSPNWVRFVFDGDGSDTVVAGPPGSEFIEQLFVDYFKGEGLPTDPCILDGGSDYLSFMLAGIPVGGLYTGSSEIKTEGQAAIYGGVAGKPCDGNYHTKRDTLKHSNLMIEEQMLGAMAYAVEYFADQPLPVPEVGETRAAEALHLEYRGPLVVR